MNHDLQNNIQHIINQIDICIRNKNDEALALSTLAQKFGYSEYYFSRKFKQISGMQFRDYLRYRKLAFALNQIRNTQNNILDIALDYGFSSHESFTRAFKSAYGITPSEYRKKEVPVVLRTIIKPFDCYLLNNDKADMQQTADAIKTYFVTIPAHKFLHIKNYGSIGYWDFWQKQNLIPGQDYQTVCRLLDTIQGKLDAPCENSPNSHGGQIMAFINDPAGRICSWGIPLAECYGVRLPSDDAGNIPSQMLMIDVPEADYLVFEHGPFDFDTENMLVEEKMEKAMREFDYSATGYHLDLSPGRIFYFYHDCKRFWKYIRPVKR